MNEFTDERTIVICTDKKGLYLMNRDTLEVYRYVVNFKDASKSGGMIGLVTAVSIPVVGLLLEPVRALLYIESWEGDISSMIIAATLFIYILLGVFLERVINIIITLSKFKNRIDKEDIKSCKLIKVTDRERKKLIKKSLFEGLYLSGFIAVLWLILVSPLINEFITYANLLTYFWLSLASFILVVPMVVMIRIFIFVLRVIIKEKFLREKN